MDVQELASNTLVGFMMTASDATQAAVAAKFLDLASTKLPRRRPTAKTKPDATPAKLKKLQAKVEPGCEGWGGVQSLTLACCLL